MHAAVAPVACAAADEPQVEQIEMQELPATAKLRQGRVTAGGRIILAGAIVNVSLTMVKIIAGIVGRSQALVADGVHSLSDLATDFVAYLGLRYSSKPRDEDHPYGHGKIETLATTFVGVLLVVTGVILAYQGVHSAWHGTAERPRTIALVAAVVSIIFKEGLYWYTKIYAERLNSSVLVANAWHHRSDALSSVAALIGVWGARLGVPALDPIAAAAVALTIAWVGLKVVIRSSRELVEESIQEEKAASFVRTAAAVPGVRSVSEMNSRQVGPAVVVDISITVDGDLTVTAGHDIAHGVEGALVKAFPTIELVTVHVEPHTDDPLETAPSTLVSLSPDAHNRQS